MHRRLVTCGTIKTMIGAVGIVLAASSLLVMRNGQAAEPVGTAAGVVGTIEISSAARELPALAATGLGLFLGDRLASEEASRMQALLLDQTVITIGPNSVLIIDELVYDPAGGAGVLTATFSEGLFRYIGGDIAKTEAENVTIITPGGAISVSGTALFVVDDPETGSMFVGLLGPARSRTTDLRPGGFVFTNELGSTAVVRPGFGVFVAKTRDSAPGEAVRTPLRLVRLLQQQLTAVPSAPVGEAAGAAAANSSIDNAAEAAGQDIADTRAAALNLDRLFDDVQRMNRMVNEATELGHGRGDPSFESFRFLTPPFP